MTTEVQRVNSIVDPCSNFPYRITVLIAAHNEEDCIEMALDSVLEQTRPPDLILVAADNCTDRTVELARSRPGVVVFETENNSDRKCGALNQGWERSHWYTDFYIFIDADTVLPQNSVEEWEKELASDEKIAAISGKFTMLTSSQFHKMANDGELPKSCLNVPDMSIRERMWVSLQRGEFAKWADAGLRRKGKYGPRWTNVIGGCAAAIRKSVIEEVISERAQSGVYGDNPTPWTNTSMVEDFELTFQMRSLGYQCRVSATVRAYTGTMMSLKKLWAQRMKWQVGTAGDLRKIGFEKLTAYDWYQQALGIFTAICRICWISLIVLDLAFFQKVALMKFWYIFPLAFIAVEVKDAMRIPHRQKMDILLAAVFVPAEAFAWIRAAWCVAAWFQVFRGAKKDYWLLQGAAEGDITAILELEGEPCESMPTLVTLSTQSTLETA